MDLSYLELNDIVTDRCRKDLSYAKKFRKAGRSVLDDVRKLSDDELIAKLASLGIHMSKTELEQLIQSNESAESIACRLDDENDVDTSDFASEWVWLSVCALWERWFPEKPSTEMLAEEMRKGYQCVEEDNEKKACDVWLPLWRKLKVVIGARGFQSPHDLDSYVRGSQFVSNWVSDFRDALWNTGREDKEYHHLLLAYSQELLALLPGECALNRENSRRTIAECHTSLGHRDVADQLYTEWLGQDPQWGWGHIGWSDCYTFIDKENRDYIKAEAILRHALSIKDVRDKVDIYDRLIGNLYDVGKHDEAEQLKAEALRYERENRNKRWAHESDADEFMPSLPAKRNATKVGRNDPCPCGSSKKYKKCCLLSQTPGDKTEVLSIQ